MNRFQKFIARVFRIPTVGTPSNIIRLEPADVLIVTLERPFSGQEACNRYAEKLRERLGADQKIFVSPVPATFSVIHRPGKENL